MNYEDIINNSIYFNFYFYTIFLVFIVTLEYDTNGFGWCPYDSLESLLRNWKFI